jgi:hypothetical protein
MSGVDIRLKDLPTAVDGDARRSRFLRRDWVLMPAIGLLTICLMVASIEYIAREMFRKSTSTTLSCLILNDPLTGVRAIPNSVCSQKAYESKLVEYRFNGCGYRTGMGCGEKPPGTYRIVMIGSSFNFGMMVPREQSFAALLPVQLGNKTGRQIELYNESMQWGFPASAALRFRQALAAGPDMILWVLTPADIASSSVVLPYMGPPDSARSDRVPADKLDRVKAAFADNPIPTAIDTVWNNEIVSSWDRRINAVRETPLGFLLQHFLYASQTLYVKSYLMGNDSEVGFLQIQPSAVWQQDLRQFVIDAANIEGQARAAGIPVVVALVPNRAEAAMISMGQWPAGFDPYKLDTELRSIITSHGGTYIDILPDFRGVPNSERYYFPVDGHPDPDGHAMIAEMLARELTTGAVSALSTAAKTQAVSEGGR